MGKSAPHPLLNGCAPGFQGADVQRPFETASRRKLLKILKPLPEIQILFRHRAQHRVVSDGLPHGFGRFKVVLNHQRAVEGADAGAGDDLVIDAQSPAGPPRRRSGRSRGNRPAQYNSSFQCCLILSKRSRRECPRLCCTSPSSWWRREKNQWVSYRPCRRVFWTT